MYARLNIVNFIILIHEKYKGAIYKKNQKQKSDKHGEKIFIIKLKRTILCAS